MVHIKIMNRIFEVFLTLVFAIILAAPAQAVVQMRVIVYGDSLTAGYQLGVEESYASKLSRKLREMGYQQVEVLNFSSPTQTSSSGLEGVNQLISRGPDVVVVQLGNNDIWRGINVELIKTNLEATVKQLLGKNIFVVLVGAEAINATGTPYADNVREMYARLGNKPGVALYPNILKYIYNSPGLTLADGVHPNAKGMDLIVEETYRLVDSGLRARWEIRQQEEYQRQYRSSYPSGTAPAGTVVIPLEDAPTPAPRSKKEIEKAKKEKEKKLKDDRKLMNSIK